MTSASQCGADGECVVPLTNLALVSPKGQQGALYLDTCLAAFSVVRPIDRRGGAIVLTHTADHFWIMDIREIVGQGVWMEKAVILGFA